MARVLHQPHVGIDLVKQRMLDHLRTHGILKVEVFAEQEGLLTCDVNRAAFFLRHESPSLINQVGNTTQYRLSAHGAKKYGVTPPPLHLASGQRKVTVAPGPRGQLVIALKEKPSSVAELARKTRLKELQVRWYLKTLKERCLILESRSPDDARIVLYRLKTVTYEPGKPVLTTAIVPLTDPSDWHTWAERLLLEQMGGPKVVSETLPADVAKLVTSAELTKVQLPRVLVIGTESEMRQQVLNEFSDRLRVDFHDSKSHSNGLASACRRYDRVFLCVRRASHSHQTAVRQSKTPLVLVSGRYGQLQMALHTFCNATAARASIERLFR